MNSFATYGLPSSLLLELNTQNILVPTEIQESTIPLLLKHKGDFVGQAPTGTGKTLAYTLPLFQRIDVTKGVVQAVVLVPTRELCEQVGSEMTKYANAVEGLQVEYVYGGLSLKKQSKALSTGAQVIVATPGRLMDLIQRKIVYLASLEVVVFDEADEMLLKGFTTDIDKILATSNRTYSSWLFSATMPVDVKKVVKKYLNKELQTVRIGEESKTNVGIQHQFIEVNSEDKLNVLLHFLTRFGEQKGIVFCRTKSGVQKLYKQLSANKFKSGAVHGDLPQGLRNKVMEQYREGSINLLLATDVASRGIDVEDVSFVIQYHISDTLDAYTHRSGRTSRAGKTGVCLTFVFEEEKEKILEFNQMLQLNIEELDQPSYKDQMINKSILWARKIAKQKSLLEKVTSNDILDFKEQLQHLSKDELLEKLMANYLREQQGE